MSRISARMKRHPIDRVRFAVDRDVYSVSTFPPCGKRRCCFTITAHRVSHSHSIYIMSYNSFFSPIIHLSFISGLLPCLEKEEDYHARLALKALQKQRILYQSTRENSSSNSSISMSSLKKLFGSNAASEEDVLARLIFRDNDDGDPELIVVVSDSVEKLALPLGKVNRVVLEGSSGSIVLLGKPPLDMQGKPEGPAKEELRCVLIQEGRNNATEQDADADSDTNEANPSSPSYLPVSNDTRNTLIHHLQVLVEWERQRRQVLSLDSLEDEPNFLRKKAQTATRFAQRELELRETTRARAERKAKLVAQAGGLKYTALAMANNRQGEMG